MGRTAVGGRLRVVYVIPVENKILLDCLGSCPLVYQGGFQKLSSIRYVHAEFRIHSMKKRRKKCLQLYLYIQFGM